MNKIKSVNMKKNKAFLKNFLKASKSKQIQLLQGLSSKECVAIYEIVKNILSGNIKINKQSFKILRKYKPQLRKLCSRKVPEKNKQKYINQKGNGFAPALAFV